MAGQSGKRIAAENKKFLSLYVQLTLLANFVFVCFRFFLFANEDTSISKLLFGLLTVDCTIASCFWWLVANNQAKVELGSGFGTYFSDMLYISIFVLFSTALLSDWFWYTFLLIPIYAGYRVLSFTGVLKSKKKTAPVKRASYLK